MAQEPVAPSSEGRREQLIAAGLELFRTRRYEDTSIEEIAEFAGVSKGLLYHYFPTKKNFVLATLLRDQSEVIARLAPDPGLEPPVQFAAALAAFIDYVEERPSPISEVFTARAAPTPRSPPFSPRAALASSRY
jgi:AcrR family transcriptional regulator